MAMIYLKQECMLLFSNNRPIVYTAVYLLVKPWESTLQMSALVCIMELTVQSREEVISWGVITAART